MTCYNDGDAVGQELVHLQLLRVEDAQLCVRVLDVVQVLRSHLQSTHDHFVSKFTKIPLGPGVDSQTSEGGKHTCIGLFWKRGGSGEGKEHDLERAAEPTTPLSILEKMSLMVARSKGPDFPLPSHLGQLV
uniref:Uncharacterized protein n=1 Tax=Nothobranchius furzeri TaxID=105023 RepID=A0A8C6LA54_NOTFU